MKLSIHHPFITPQSIWDNVKSHITLVKMTNSCLADVKRGAIWKVGMSTAHRNRDTRAHVAPPPSPQLFPKQCRLCSNFILELERHCTGVSVSRIAEKFLSQFEKLPLLRVNVLPPPPASLGRLIAMILRLDARSRPPGG